MATGGSGYLGRALTHIAAAAGWAVTATSQSTPGPARLDVRDRARGPGHADTLRPAAVVHTAYVQQAPGAWDVTATASGVVAGEAAAVGARLVHLSTEFAALVVGHPVWGVPAPAGRPLDCRLDSTLARGALRTRLRGVHDVLAAQR